MDHGLPQSQVIDMCQDSEGFIWFATQGAGLCRFDGNKFTYFTEEDGLPQGNIWKLLCDHNGAIWIATQAGIARYDGTKFTSWTRETGLVGEAVWAIYEDSRGYLWLGMEEGGVMRFDGTDFKLFGPDQGLPFNDGNTILEDSRGNIWIGSYGEGLCQFDGVDYHHYTTEENLAGYYVTSLLEVRTDEVWIGTEAGISVFDGRELSPLPDSVVGTQAVEDLMKDKHGNVWIATYDNGTFMYNEHQTIHFDKNNGLPTNYMYSLLQDNVGNVWIGTNGGGVSKFEGQMFTHTTSKDGLASDVVMSILEDRKGNFWFATEEGLTKYDGKNYVQFTMADGLPSRDLYYLYEDRRGIIWVSAFTGAAQIINDQVFPVTEKQGFTSAAATTFFEDHSGRLWIGSEDGAYIYEDGTYTRYNPDSLLSEGVARIYEDSDRNMWFCTSNGITMLAVDKAMHYGVEDGLSGEEVDDVWEDPAGKLWFLTDNGLSVFSNNRFHHVGLNKGLSSENLYCMVYDGKNLWVGTEKGVDRIVLSEQYEIEEVKHYGRSDGFKGVECNSWAAFQDSKGHLWFGTISGATRYNSRYDNPNIVPPLLKLTNLRLFYESVNWQERCVNPISNYKDVPLNPLLSFRDNHLTFDFIGLDFTTPEEVRYQFMLEGFDPDWQPETDQNTITYSNLPPGEYTFVIIAKNADGVWSDEVRYPFAIEAPFWMKTWFYLVSIPVGLVIIYGFILMRTRRIARSKRELEELVRLRTKDLRKQKKEVEKLSVVASQTEDGIIIADAHGELNWMNHSMHRITGLSMEKFKNMFGSNVAQVCEHQDIQGFLKRVKNKKETLHYDVLAPKMPGIKEDEHWLTVSVSPTYNDRDELSNIVIVYTDITDRKRAEDQLIRINKDITDSIQYASQIQTAIMPGMDILREPFPDSFVFLRPRDIVSGDFYWFSQIGTNFIWCAVDCTGHGVPGAFMSMIGNEFLHQIVNNGNITGAEQALRELDQMIKRALHKTGADKDAKDGMDMGLCVVNLETLFCQYAGAFNPMYIIRNGELLEYEANKYSIGSMPDDIGDLIEHKVQLQEGDILYLFSDGIIDQFGGDKGKKYMRGRFKKFLLSITHLSMQEQEKQIELEFNNWKGERDQLDDVLVIGVRVKDTKSSTKAPLRKIET